MIYHNKSSNISSSASTSSPSSASALAGSAFMSLLSSFFDCGWYAKSEALTSLGYYSISAIYLSFDPSFACLLSILLRIISSPISRIAKVNLSSLVDSTNAGDSKSLSASFNDCSLYPTWLYFWFTVAYIISLVWLSLPICTVLKIVCLNIDFIVS